MFILLDKTTNHVRVVVKDQTYAVEDAPPKAKQVSIPNSVQQLIRGSNYIPAAIAGSVLGTAALAGGIAYAVKNRGASNSQSRTDLVVGGGGNLRDDSPQHAFAPSILAEHPLDVFEEKDPQPAIAPSFVPPAPEVGNNLVLGRIFGDYVEPIPSSYYVSTNVPGTFYGASEAQQYAFDVASNIAKGTPLANYPTTLPADINYPTTLPADITWGNGEFKFRMHMGSPEIVLPLVWGTVESKPNPQKPWVYYYNVKNKWRYFRTKDPILMKWSNNVSIDMELASAYLTNSEFDMAYKKCMEHILDFQRVKSLHNIFYLIKENDLNPIKTPKSNVLVSMMRDSHIMWTQDLQNILQLTLDTVKEDDTHPVYEVYTKLNDWMDLAHRLLTKRVLWYYAEDDVWGFNGWTESGARRYVGVGHDTYEKFASNKGWENYLHPDESIISSLLGIKVPSFAYDNGMRTEAGKSPPSFDTEVVMLGQVGARLEDHSLLSQGDLILVDNNAPVITPFQIALKKGLSAMDRTNLYTARSCVILQQAIDTAINHSQPTHLILTGIGQGYWQGDFAEITVPAFSNALIETVTNIKRKGNLEYLTLIAYNARPEFEQIDMTPYTIRLAAACEVHKITFDYESDFRKQVFGRLKQIDVMPVDMFSFAWDGMSLVGNEYYDNSRCGQSADPAAACSTSIAFLAHPKINPDMYRRFPPYANIPVQ